MKKDKALVEVEYLLEEKWSDGVWRISNSSKDADYINGLRNRLKVIDSKTEYRIAKRTTKTEILSHQEAPDENN